MSLAWVKGKLNQGKFVEHRYQEGNDTAINSCQLKGKPKVITGRKINNPKVSENQ